MSIIKERDVIETEIRGNFENGFARSWDEYTHADNILFRPQEIHEFVHKSNGKETIRLFTPMVPFRFKNQPSFTSDFYIAIDGIDVIEEISCMDINEFSKFIKKHRENTDFSVTNPFCHLSFFPQIYAPYNDGTGEMCHIFRYGFDNYNGCSLKRHRSRYEKEDKGKGRGVALPWLPDASEVIHSINQEFVMDMTYGLGTHDGKFHHDMKCLIEPNNLIFDTVMGSKRFDGKYHHMLNKNGKSLLKTKKEPSSILRNVILKNDRCAAIEFLGVILIKGSSHSYIHDPKEHSNNQDIHWYLERDKTPWALKNEDNFNKFKEKYPIIDIDYKTMIELLSFETYKNHIDLIKKDKKHQ